MPEGGVALARRKGARDYSFQISGTSQAAASIQQGNRLQRWRDEPLDFTPGEYLHADLWIPSGSSFLVGWLWTAWYGVWRGALLVKPISFIFGCVEGTGDGHCSSPEEHKGTRCLTDH